jgi:hypothetical protein
MPGSRAASATPVAKAPTPRCARRWRHVAAVFDRASTSARSEKCQRAHKRNVSARPLSARRRQWRRTHRRQQADRRGSRHQSYADLGQFDDAWRSLGEAIDTIETTKETWFEAEANRIAGEIALQSPKLDATKAQAYFERALAVSRLQQAKSWELRAAMSLARLWRDQGKVSEARELLAPVYGWFTEGFDTLDLKEAKALLEELAA